jgi:hypothetical protein
VCVNVYATAQALFEGDEARGLRELGGIAASDFTACFQKADIEALFLQPLRTVRSMPRVIYLTVDPNGGGMSKMGVVSGFFDGTDIVVSISLVVLLCVSAWVRPCTSRQEIGRQCINVVH